MGHDEEWRKPGLSTILPAGKYIIFESGFMLCGKKNKEHKFKSAHEIVELII